jgi:hypothetical protein
LLSPLIYSQIWLNLPMDDCHFDYIANLPPKKNTKCYQTTMDEYWWSKSCNKSKFMLMTLTLPKNHGWIGSNNLWSKTRPWPSTLGVESSSQVGWWSGGEEPWTIRCTLWANIWWEIIVHDWSFIWWEIIVHEILVLHSKIVFAHGCCL